MEDKLPEFLSLQQEAANEKTMGDRLTELAKVSTELAQLIAKNPSTPPELLRELANSNDATTCQNVAANPNTPTEVLLNLGAKFPEQLLDNPIFSLLLLENPNLVNKMPIATLISILNLEKAPVFFLEQAVNIEGYLVCQEVANNPKVPLKLLEQLTQSNDAFVRHSVAKNPRITVKLLEQLARDDNYLVRISVAKNCNAPVKLIEQLLHDDDDFVRHYAAQNSNIPIKLLGAVKKNYFGVFVWFFR